MISTRLPRMKKPLLIRDHGWSRWDGKKWVSDGPSRDPYWVAAEFRPVLERAFAVLRAIARFWPCIRRERKPS